MQLEAPNFEADDVIATLVTMALKEGVSANIFLGDKDLMQLITPEYVPYKFQCKVVIGVSIFSCGFYHLHRGEVPLIQMVDPMTMSHVSHNVAVSKWNVTPNQLGDVLALAGDSADNIPGIHGIGPKIAASLISEYRMLDQLLKQVETVKQKGRHTKLINSMTRQGSHGNWWIWNAQYPWTT
jgi:DNA polymerase-1